MIYMKKVISFLSACFLFISCFAFNASAEDDSSFSEFQFTVNYMSVLERLSKNYGVSDPSSLDYIYFYYGSNDYQFIIIPPDLPLGDGVYFGNVYNESSRMIIFGEETYNSLNNGFTSYTGFNQVRVFSSNSVSSFSLSDTKTVDNEIFLYKYLGHPEAPVYSSVPVFDFSSRELIIEPPSSGPIDVTFSPSLYLNMEGGTISYPSKGNGSEVVQHVYDINCSVSLTETFLDSVKSSSIEYTYQFTSFIVPSQYKNSDVQTMAAHSIFTCVNRGDYIYEDNHEFLILDDDRNVQQGDIDDNGFTSLNADTDDTNPDNASANGLTNIFVIPRDKGSVDFTINMQNIDWASLGSGSFNVITLAHLTCKNEFGYSGHSFYYNSLYSGLERESVGFYPLGLSDDCEKIELYEYYTVVSDDFSWNDEDIPPYDPLTTRYDADGNPWNPNANPLDFNNSAMGISTLSDYLNGKSKTPSEFEEYRNNWPIGDNFSAQNFTDLGELFSTSGSFYAFLTSGLNILPSWFLAIFTAFFTLLLALALIKFILD